MKLKQKKADSGPSKTSKEMHALLQKKKRNDTGILKQEKTSGRKIIVAKLTE